MHVEVGLYGRYEYSEAEECPYDWNEHYHGHKYYSPACLLSCLGLHPVIERPLCIASALSIETRDVNNYVLNLEDLRN